MTSNARLIKKNWEPYNLAFFFGPGLPLTLGGASGPSAAAVLLPPFFLTASVGGGINDGPGVPMGAGVFELDSDGLSPFELVATGGAAGAVVVGAVFFIGFASSLAGTGTGAGDGVGGENRCKALGDSFSLIIICFGGVFAVVDFRLGAGGMGFAEDDIAMVSMVVRMFSIAGRR